MKHPLLSQFCDPEADEKCAFFREPSVYNGWLYASDASIAIREPTLEGGPVVEGTSRIAALFTRFDVATCTGSLPKPRNTRHCTGCEGDGLVRCDYCDRSQRCKSCRGRGNLEDHQSIQGALYNGAYLHLIRQLPDVRIGKAKVFGVLSLPFVDSAGRQGIVCPLS